MIYKEFIAKAAIEIMAHQCESFNERMFTNTDKDGNITGPSIEVIEAAHNSLIAAKELADQLDEDFVYSDEDIENNHKMSKFEPFFDKYEVE